MADSQHDSHLPRTENPATLSKPGGHYSHVAVANGFVFVSGQLPITPQGDKLSEASFEVQAEQVLANVREKPVTSLAIAAGVGFLFALLSRR